MSWARACLCTPTGFAVMRAQSLTLICIGLAWCGGRGLKLGFINRIILLIILTVGAFLVAARSARPPSVQVGRRVAGGSSPGILNDFAPRFTGPYLFWLRGDKASNSGYLYLRDTRTGYNRRITRSASALGSTSDTDGRVVLWTDCGSYRCAPTLTMSSLVTPTIKGLDLASGRTFDVARDGAAQWSGCLVDHSIVLNEIRGGRSRVYLSSHTSGQVQPLAVDPGNQTATCAADGFVIWQQVSEKPGESWIIYARNLRTGMGRVLSRYRSLNDFPESPIAGGSLTAWVHWRPDRSVAIEGVDVRSGTTLVVTTISATQTNPQRGPDIAVVPPYIFWGQTTRAPYDADRTVVLARNIITHRLYRLNISVCSLGLTAFPAIGAHLIACEAMHSGHTVIRIAPRALTPYP